LVRAAGVSVQARDADGQAAQVRDLGGTVEPGPGRRQRGLELRRARRPWPVLTGETEGVQAQGNFLSCSYRPGMLALTVIT
jgi:hypothetical protein